MMQDPDPVPLIADHLRLDLDELPPFIAELTDGISRQFQIDPVIPFGTILGCVAAAAQGKIRTQISPSWIEHSSIYIINIAETGDGKSQVMNRCASPSMTMNHSCALMRLQITACEKPSTKSPRINSKRLKIQ